MITCPTISLSELTDLFLVLKFNEKRKYYKAYSILFQQVFSEIFTQTWYTIPNQYMELKAGNPYNYIDIPEGMQRLLSVGVSGRDGRLKPLYYNQDVNVIPKPKRKPCGCDSQSCNCAGLCESIGGLVVTTKEVIIDNPDSSPPGQPTTYTEYQWLKYCPNGDIFEYRQIPTIQYQLSSGSYDDSYDVSYEVGTSGSSVVVVNLTRKLCSLEILPCGCPTQTQHNEELFFKNCGCFINEFTPIREKRNKFWNECNYWAGEVKLSPCGKKIEVIWVEHIEDNHHLLVSFQTNGLNVTGGVQVPNNEATKMCMYAGVEYHRIIFNDKYSLGQKQEAFYLYEAKKADLIKWLNPLSTEWARSVPTMATW